MSERAGAATVVAQEGTEVEVDHAGRRVRARMVGFPLGFTLRPGARVVLRDERDGLTARPLVRAVTSPTREPVEAEGQLRVADRDLTVEEGAVVSDEPRAGRRADEGTTFWVVESTGAEPDQVIAVRTVR